MTYNFQIKSCTKSDNGWHRGVSDAVVRRCMVYIIFSAIAADSLMLAHKTLITTFSSNSEGIA